MLHTGKRWQLQIIHSAASLNIMDLLPSKTSFTPRCISQCHYFAIWLRLAVSGHEHNSQVLSVLTACCFNHSAAFRQALRQIRFNAECRCPKLRLPEEVRAQTKSSARLRTPSGCRANIEACIHGCRDCRRRRGCCCPCRGSHFPVCLAASQAEERGWRDLLSRHYKRALQGSLQPL